MGKLGLIIKREYLAKVRNKSFIIMTFLSPVLMVAMVVLISFLAKVNDSEKRVISVLNESSYLPWSFETNQSISYVSLRDIDLEQAIDSTRSLGFYGLLHIPDEPSLEQAADSAYL
jgi:ABC-2 type transport system permease protein